MNDHEIIHAIREGKLESSIRLLYAEFPKVSSLLLKEGAQKDWVNEIFNDSLVILIEKVKNPSFQLESKLSTYLTGINRFLLKNEIRKRNKYDRLHPSLGENEIVAHDLTIDFERENKLKMMEKILLNLSQKCQEMLHFFYFEKLSMSAIAQKLGFSSEKSAKTQKYKCLEKAHQEANRLIIHQENTVS